MTSAIIKASVIQYCDLTDVGPGILWMGTHDSPESTVIKQHTNMNTIEGLCHSKHSLTENVHVFFCCFFSHVLITLSRFATS